MYKILKSNIAIITLLNMIFLFNNKFCMESKKSSSSNMMESYLANILEESIHSTRKQSLTHSERSSSTIDSDNESDDHCQQLAGKNFQNLLKSPSTLPTIVKSNLIIEQEVEKKKFLIITLAKQIHEEYSELIHLKKKLKNHEETKEQLQAQKIPLILNPNYKKAMSTDTER